MGQLQNADLNTSKLWYIWNLFFLNPNVSVQGSLLNTLYAATDTMLIAVWTLTNTLEITFFKLVQKLDPYPRICVFEVVESERKFGSPQRIDIFNSLLLTKEYDRSPKCFPVLLKDFSESTTTKRQFILMGIWWYHQIPFQWSIMWNSLHFGPRYMFVTYYRNERNQINVSVLVLPTSSIQKSWVSTHKNHKFGLKTQDILKKYMLSCFFFAFRFLHLGYVHAWVTCSAFLLNH